MHAILADVAPQTAGIVGGVCLVVGGAMTALANYYRTRAKPNGQAKSDDVARARCDALDLRAEAHDEAHIRLWERLDGVGQEVAATRAEVVILRERQERTERRLGDVADGVARIEGYLKGRAEA